MFCGFYANSTCVAVDVAAVSVVLAAVTALVAFSILHFLPCVVRCLLVRNSIVDLKVYGVTLRICTFLKPVEW